MIVDMIAASFYSFIHTSNDGYSVPLSPFIIKIRVRSVLGFDDQCFLQLPTEREKERERESSWSSKCTGRSSLHNPQGRKFWSLMSHAFRRAKDRRKRSSLQSFWSSGIVDLDLCRGRLRVGESRAA